MKNPKPTSKANPDCSICDGTGTDIQEYSGGVTVERICACRYRDPEADAGAKPFKYGNQMSAVLQILLDEPLGKWVRPNDVCFTEVFLPDGSAKWLSWKGATRLTDIYQLMQADEIEREMVRGTRDLRAKWYNYRLTEKGKVRARELFKEHNPIN